MFHLLSEQPHGDIEPNDGRLCIRSPELYSHPSARSVSLATGHVMVSFPSLKSTTSATLRTMDSDKTGHGDRTG